MIGIAPREASRRRLPARVARSAAGIAGSPLIPAILTAPWVASAPQPSAASSIAAPAKVTPYRVGVFLFGHGERHETQSVWLKRLAKNLADYASQRGTDFRILERFEITILDEYNFACLTQSGEAITKDEIIFDPALDTQMRGKAATAHDIRALKGGLADYTVQMATLDVDDYDYVEDCADDRERLEADLAAHSERLGAEDQQYFDAFYMLKLQPVQGATGLKYPWEIQSRMFSVQARDGRKRITASSLTKFAIWKGGSSSSNGTLAISHSSRDDLPPRITHVLSLDEIDTFTNSAPYFAYLAVLEISHSWSNTDSRRVHVLCATIEPLEAASKLRAAKASEEHKAHIAADGLLNMEDAVLSSISEQIAAVIDAEAIPQLENENSAKFGPSTFEPKGRCSGNRDRAPSDTTAELRAMVSGADYLLDFRYELPPGGGGVKIWLVLKKPEHLAKKNLKYEVEREGLEITNTVDELENRLKDAAQAEFAGLVDEIEE